VPPACLSDFNPFNVTWCVVEVFEVVEVVEIVEVVEEDGPDFRRRDLSWSFSENEPPDFDFIVEVWLLTLEVLAWSRGVEWTVVRWFIVEFTTRWLCWLVGAELVGRVGGGPTPKPAIFIHQTSCT